MSKEETLETYFNAEDLFGARALVEVFQGRILISDELSISDRVLLGIYMVSNQEKASELKSSLVQDFMEKLGVSSEKFSKGTYELRKAGQVTDTIGRISLTFKGLKAVRKILSVPPAEPSKASSEPGEIPSIGTSNTIRQAITSLLSSEWGKKPRTAKELIKALEVNALYYPETSVMGTLTFMTQEALVRRMKSNGSYAYVLRRPVR